MGWRLFDQSGEAIPRPETLALHPAANLCCPI